MLSRTDLTLYSSYKQNRKFVVISGQTDQEHLNSLTTVLQRLSAAGMKLKSEKCHSMLQEVEHLGHTISAKGLQPTTQKVHAIVDAMMPHNQKMCHH